MLLWRYSGLEARALVSADLCTFVIAASFERCRAFNPRLGGSETARLASSRDTLDPEVLEAAARTVRKPIPGQHQWRVFCVLG
jgi:hypothetical protein